MRRLIPVALAAASISGALPAAAHADETGYVPGELLVRFEPSVSGQHVRAVLDDAGAAVERNLTLVPGLRQVELPDGAPVPDVAARLERQPGVAYAEPNWRRERFTVPSDPLFGEQWSLLNTGQTVFQAKGTAGADIRATPAWSVQDGSATVRVGVVDTGITMTHPDLAGNIWTNPGEVAANGLDDDANGQIDDVHGYDFIAGDGDPSDSFDPDQGHGTHIAGIIGATGNNGIGIAGVNWDVALMAVRTPLDLAGEVAAFKYARDNGARVINYSAGSNQYSLTELDAIQAAPNVLFAVAAGNDHVNVDGEPSYPCSYPAENIVCVASTDQNDALSSFSDFGPSTVDLAAPGENIISTFPAGASSRELNDHFSDLPLAERGRMGGRGKKWRLTQKLKRGFSITDSPHGRYRNESNAWIRSNPIDLTEREGCGVEYYAKVRTEPHHDFLLVEASRNGRKHWRVMRRHSGATRHTRFAHLPKHFAGDASVYLRFRLKSDKSGRRNGAFVDDVAVTCETTADTYAFLTGTSFSAPDVAGAAALVLAQNPGFDAAELRAKLLASVDQLNSLSGRVATAGRLNVAKAVSP
ncbi:MAG: S8 family serine peptidase [Solirubrobacterales bacterium]